jgi:ketosteroid isomerase-like protein
MRSILATTTLLIVCSAQPARAQNQHPAQPAEAGAGVQRTIEALFRAVEQKDLAALDTLYAGERLTIIEGAGINRGWADYRDHHLAPELKEFTDFRYRPADIEVELHGEMAWAIFRYTLQAKMGERTLDMVGRGTAVLDQRGDRWVIRHTHTSSRARRPSDPTVTPQQ